MERAAIAKRYLNRTEASDYLGVCVRTLDLWVANDGLGRIRLGRRVLFDINSLDKFMEQHIERALRPGETAVA